MTDQSMRSLCARPARQDVTLLRGQVAGTGGGRHPGGGRDGADGVPPVLAPLTALRPYTVLAVTFSNLDIAGMAHRGDIQLVGDTGISRRIP